MAEVFYFGQIFNTITFGLPVYYWVVLLLGIVLVFSNLMWYIMMWKPLTPLHGLYRAYKTQTDAALLQDMNNNLQLVSEARAKVIFDEPILEAKKGEKDWKKTTSGQIGVVGIDIIVDVNEWSKKTSENHLVIEEAADNWNLEHPEDQIHSYGKFMEYCDNGKIFVDIPTYTLIKWIRIESAFPKQRLKAFFGGYVRQLAEKLDGSETNNINKMGMYILIGSVGVSLAFALARYF